MSESEQQPPYTELPAPDIAPQWPPVAQPIPVQSLGYSVQVQRYARPGILSGISVIGIVVACLSAIASLMSGCQAGSFYLVSKMSKAMPTSTSSVTTTSGGSTSTIITSPGSVPVTQPVIGMNSLTAAEVSGAITRAQSASGNKLNPAQIAALTTALQDPNQTLVSPGTAWSPVQMASVQPDGSAMVQMTGGFVSLTPAGQLTLAAMPTFNVSGLACGLSAVDAVASFLLAVYLLIAAIVVMNNSPSGRRLHLIYAVLKIPVAIVGAIGLGMLYSEFYGGLGAGGAMQTAEWVVGSIVGVLGLIYPISLLIAFNTRGVREYYHSAR